MKIKDLKKNVHIINLISKFLINFKPFKNKI